MNLRRVRYLSYPLYANNEFRYPSCTQITNFDIRVYFLNLAEGQKHPHESLVDYDLSQCKTRLKIGKLKKTKKYLGFLVLTLTDKVKT